MRPFEFLVEIAEDLLQLWDRKLAGPPKSKMILSDRKIWRVLKNSRQDFWITSWVQLHIKPPVCLVAGKLTKS